MFPSAALKGSSALRPKRLLVWASTKCDSLSPALRKALVPKWGCSTRSPARVCRHAGMVPLLCDSLSGLQRSTWLTQCLTCCMLAKSASPAACFVKRNVNA